MKYINEPDKNNNLHDKSTAFGRLGRRFDRFDGYTNALLSRLSTNQAVCIIFIKTDIKDIQ